MREVVLSLGSNVGDSPAILQGAVADLARLAGFTVVAASPVYRTAPVGGVEQPDFLNAIVIGTTDFTNEELISAVLAIELAWKRTRDVHWGPRTLDIDVISIGNESSDDVRLTLPHPRAHERAFVLVPWLQVDPSAALPNRGAVADLLAMMDTSDVVRTDISLAVTGR